MLTVNPKDRDLRYNKALVLHAQSKFKDAISLYTELNAEQPDNKLKEYIYNAYISQGKQYTAEKNYRKAADSFESAISTNNLEVEPYVLLAKAYDNLGSASKTIEYYEKAISIDPDNKTITADYAKALIKYKKTEDAHKIAENISTDESVSQKDRATTLISLGEQYYNNKDYKNAKIEFEKALTHDTNNEALIIKTGNCYKQLAENEKALELYNKVITINDKNTDANFNAGLCYVDLNKPDEAIKAFNKVVQLDENYAYAYYALGLEYEKAQKWTEAVQNYEKFMNLTEDTGIKNSIKAKINDITKKQLKK